MNEEKEIEVTEDDKVEELAEKIMASVEAKMSKKAEDAKAKEIATPEVNEKMFESKYGSIDKSSCLVDGISTS